MNSEWTFEFFPQGGKTIDFIAMEQSTYLGPFIKDMVFCIQDGKYHSEGDVWTHTKMCLNHLLTLNEYQVLDKEDQQILFLATLLHDVGKPITTKTEEDAITSKGHSVKGARLARELMINWNMKKDTHIPFHVREHVCNLILLHMLPVYLLEKTDPLYSAAASSTVLTNRLLATLSIADINGRWCLDKYKERAIERVELFSLFCDENDCYSKTFPFPSDRARFRYFFEHKGHPNYDYFEPIKGQVIVMCGLQAAGKDWVIKNQYLPWEVVSLDKTRIDMDMDFGDDEPAVVQRARERCKVLMRLQTPFVFNATNVVKDIRTRWIRLFRQYRYNITIHYVERPLDIILKANKSRKHTIPEDVILQKVKKIDIPTEMECHKLILGVS